MSAAGRRGFFGGLAFGVGGVAGRRGRNFERLREELEGVAGDVGGVVVSVGPRAHGAENRDPARHTFGRQTLAEADGDLFEQLVKRAVGDAVHDDVVVFVAREEMLRDRGAAVFEKADEHGLARESVAAAEGGGDIGGELLLDPPDGEEVGEDGGEAERAGRKGEAARNRSGFERGGLGESLRAEDGNGGGFFRGGGDLRNERVERLRDEPGRIGRCFLHGEPCG